MLVRQLDPNKGSGLPLGAEEDPREAGRRGWRLESSLRVVGVGLALPSLVIPQLPRASASSRMPGTCRNLRSVRARSKGVGPTTCERVMGIAFGGGPSGSSELRLASWCIGREAFECPLELRDQPARHESNIGEQSRARGIPIEREVPRPSVLEHDRDSDLEFLIAVKDSLSHDAEEVAPSLASNSVVALESPAVVIVDPEAYGAELAAYESGNERINQVVRTRRPVDSV